MKPPLHFSTYRSGSVPIGMILEEYFRQTEGLKGLGDFFELDVVLGRDAPSRSVGRIPKTYPGKQRWIKRNHQRIFFTAYPGHDPAFFLWLSRNHQMIFSERLNLVQQTLSNLLSDETGRWYEEDGLVFGKKSVTAREAHFRFFERHMFSYFQAKALVKPRKLVTYEFFCQEGPSEMLKFLGLRKRVSLDSLELPVRQNQGRKDLSLKNMSDVRRWYRNSFLEGICPWDTGIKSP